MTQVTRSNMGDRYKEAKPTIQQAQGIQVSTAAPPNQPAAAGRLPLFRK
jgi:hypothetical protein